MIKQPPGLHCPLGILLSIALSALFTLLCQSLMMMQDLEGKA
jgi:hypothetical protein